MNTTASDDGSRAGKSSRLSFKQTSGVVTVLVVFSMPLWIRVAEPEELVNVEGRLDDFRSYKPIGTGAYLSVHFADRPEWFDLMTDDLPVVRTVLAQKGTLGFHADFRGRNRGGIRTYGLVANGSTVRDWYKQLEGHRTLVRWCPPFIGVILLGLMAMTVLARRAREGERPAG